VSTYVDQFLQHLAQSILRKYATQKLLICPSHLQNTAALSWEKLISSFQLIANWFFSSSRWVSLKRAVFLVPRWGCRLGDGQSYCRCSKWPPLVATQAVKCSHTTSAFSSCRLLKSFQYWAQCQIRE